MFGAPSERGDRLPVHSSDHPRYREIDDAADADERSEADDPFKHAAEEKPARRDFNGLERCSHGERCEKLLTDPGDKPWRHSELAATVQDDEQQSEIYPGAC